MRGGEENLTESSEKTTDIREALGELKHCYKIITRNWCIDQAI